MAAVGSVDRNLRNEDQEFVDDHKRMTGLLNGDESNGDETMPGDSMMVAGDHRTETHYHLPEPAATEPTVVDAVANAIAPVLPVAVPLLTKLAPALLGGGLGAAVLGGGMWLNSVLNPADVVTPPETPAPVVAEDRDTIGQFELDR